MCKIKQLGNICPTRERENPNQGRVYDVNGLCPSLNSMGGGNREPMILIKQATNKGYIECVQGGVADLSYPDSKTRRGRVQGGGNICPTLTASEPEIYQIIDQYRIRKLTPLECWRLMGFSDEDFHKAEEVNSNTQLYKQAGNSIVVDVLVHLFGGLAEQYKEVFDMQKTEETKLVVYETDKLFDIAALKEKEPELFDELVQDYPVEKAVYQFKVV